MILNLAIDSTILKIIWKIYSMMSTYQNNKILQLILNCSCYEFIFLSGNLNGCPVFHLETL